jgi:glycosyltransferase involved in cell wall biosynthesis
MPIPVSILICTRNRAPHLRRTLRSVDQVSIPEHLSPELVVVDNGSTDATNDILGNPPIEHLPVQSVVEPEPGVARARNRALQVARGRLLLWLDDDLRVPSNWLIHMTRPILNGDADAVAGKVVLAPHLRRPWMQKFHRTALASTNSIDPEAPRNIVSANMAFDRAVLADVQGFDPELGPGSRTGALEDTLFSWQLREAGYQIEMVTETAVEHYFDKQRLTRDAFIRAAIARGRSLSYIRYHWLHCTQEDWTHRTRAYQAWRQPHVVLAKRLVDWTLQQWVHRFGKKPAPIGRQEFWTILNAYSLHQYLAERDRPRNYAERGLCKIRGKEPSEIAPEGTSEDRI